MAQQSIESFDDHNYPLRLLAMAFVGAVIAMFLTWFMHQLIHSSQQRLDESSRTFMMEFVRLKRSESSARKQPRPARPVQQDAPPIPSAPMSDRSSDTTLAVTAMDAFANSQLQVGGPAFGGSDGEYLPIVKVAPMYPPRALNAKIEGECVVIFTVTTTGATKDVQVVKDRCSSSYFYRNSIAAASKFKYKPRIIDGEAVEVHDVRNRFVFNIKQR